MLPVFSRQYLARHTADPGLQSARVIFDEDLGNLSNTFAKYYSTNPTYYIPCFYHTFFPFWQHPIFSSLSYNRSWCIFSVCFLLCPLIFQNPNSQRTKPTSQFGVTQVRFQPIVSCQGTYQDAVSVPCLGAPFIRCIWTVGIKKCAVTVPTLRPLGLLEMRKSRLCVRPSLGTSPCATRCSRPRAPHTFGNRGRGAPGASHPARAPPQAAPSSSASS